MKNARRNHTKINDVQSSRSTDQVLHSLFGAFAESFRSQYEGAISGVIIAGSGLSDVMAHYPIIAEIDMRSLAGFPVPAVQGHGHTIRILHMNGKNIAFVSGRCHLYEGHSVFESVATIGMLRLLGASSIVITNSAGGLNTHYAVGDVMAITDTINMMSVSVLSSLGIYEDRRCVVSHISSSWLQKIMVMLSEQKEYIHAGVYTGVLGPSYETPAEIRALRIIGGDAVGMSTVHEAEFAYWCGYHVVSCSLISNLLKETSTDLLSHHDVVIAARIGAARTAKFIECAINALL